MNREDAYALTFGRLGDSATMKHSLCVEACMRALARKFNEDEQLWGISGLVHDLDLDVCGDDLENHTLVGAQILKEHNAPQPVIDAVLGHNDKLERQSLMAKALWVVDPTCGLLTAAALIHPSKDISNIKLKSLKKRLKDKRFAAAVNREQVKACDAELGLDLDSFLTICLLAMVEIKDEIGL